MNSISVFPTIDLTATGQNIVRLRKMCGLTVRDVQGYFGFEEPQAIYKWQQGKSLPTVDNLFALSVLFGVSMNEILVSRELQKEIEDDIRNGQSQDCPSHFIKNNIDKANSICTLFALFITNISRFGSNGGAKDSDQLFSAKSNRKHHSKKELYLFKQLLE